MLGVLNIIFGFVKEYCVSLIMILIVVSIQLNHISIVIAFFMGKNRIC